MTEQERARITSEDYADFIIEYGRNPRVFGRIPNATSHIINERYAVVYVPVGQLNNRSIGQYGYAIFPDAYGLLSEASLNASGVMRLRRVPAFNLRGGGVLIGIIDTGIDYTNPLFIKADGTTKIAALWDQTLESENPPQPYFYGTEFTSEQINQALQSADPMSVVPSRDENGHGTMLAGIAAGNEDPKNDFSGVAPDSELVIVKLKEMKQVLREFYILPENVIAYQENDIMWGVQYVLEVARSLGRPLVICIGVGSNQGSHDGRGALGMLLSTIGDYPGVAVTIAAGNEGNGRRHFYQRVDRAIGNATVELSVGEEEKGFTMELWGTAPNTYSIDILSPNGEYIPRIPESLRVNREVSFIFEETTINIDYFMIESQAGDQLILMRFRNPSPGIWRMQVYSQGDLEGSFHIWLPIGNFISENTYFIQSDIYTTTTSPGNALVPITITAYNPENNTLYQRASRGYSRTGTIKPELAAPGVNILGPDLNHGYIPFTGSGVAAAHGAGICAMMMEWGIVRNNYPGIDTVEIQKFLIRGAQKSATQNYPNRNWGYGMIDIYRVFDILRADNLRR